MNRLSYESYKFFQGYVSPNGDRWSSQEELASDLFRLRLSDEECIFHGGFPIISNGDEMYVDDSDTHNLIIGSTGSKKSRLFVMPMLETFRKAGESVFVTDPKGELYEKTANKFERSGYKIYVVNLREPDRSDCWNPFYLARLYAKNDHLDLGAGIINDFAETILPQKYSRNSDPFWDNCSRSLLRGMIMMMVENEELFPDDMVHLKNLRVLRYGLNDNSEPGVTYEIVKRNYPDDSLARTNLESIINGSERTFDNICVSYDASVQGLYIQNSLVEMLSGNTVDFTDLGSRKTILYLIIPDEKTTLHRIASLMIKQCYIQLIDQAQHMDHNTLPFRVNFLLDEFSNMPAIPDMAAMISAARSRNIRFHLVIQGLVQLAEKYGIETANTIKGNCSNWAFLTSRELPLLREISDLCGKNDAGTPLITVTQLQRLNKEKGEVLMLIGRHYPFIAHLPDISQYVGYQVEGEKRPLPSRRNGSCRVYSQKDLSDIANEFAPMLDDLFDFSPSGNSLPEPLLNRRPPQGV